MTQCPHCTQEIQDDPEICPYCQRDVAPLQTAAATAPMITVHRPLKLKTVIQVLFVAIYVLYKWHNYAQRDQQVVQSYSQKIEAYQQKVDAYYQQAGAWNAKCLAFVDTSPGNPIPKECEDERNALVARAKPDGWLIDKRK